MMEGLEGDDASLPTLWISFATSSSMSTSQRVFVSLLAVATLAVGSACEANRYPHCKAFEYVGPTAEPRLKDHRAKPEDCGFYRAAGDRRELMVDEPMPLDCAIEAIAAGRPMQLELHYERNDAPSEDGRLFTDDDGLALWWRAHHDGTTEFEARVHQLDVERIAGCEDEAEVDARFLCLFDALEAAEVVDTCKTGFHDVP